MQHPAIQPISFSSSFKCFLVILHALSLSLCQSHQTSYTTKLQITRLSMQRNCNLLSQLQLTRCHLFSTLTTTTKSPSTNDLTANMPKSETKHTSSESRILKLFDALDFTSAMYQPRDHFGTLVQAQHRSRENPGAQYKRSQLHLRWCP